MNNTKKLLIIIGIVIVICIICIIAMLILNKNNSNDNINTENLTDAERGPEYVNYVAERLNDPTKFFSVEKYIKDNFDENFVADDMNILNEEIITSYAVQGRVGDSQENVYFIFRVDNNNNTFSIEKVSNVSSLSEINLETDITSIENTGNNEFEYTTISSEEMCRIYLSDFVQKELNNPEEAYSMIDEIYKAERFPTYEDYQEYLNAYRNVLENSVLSKYSVEIKDTYTEYILVDNYNTSYTLRATGVKDYKILLDNYTIKVDTYEEEYSKLQDQDKVQANVYTFLQMINTKDYKHAYEVLDDTFKQNNFDTLDKFKEYVDTNFFSYNLNTTANVDINNEGSTYIYKTKIKSDVGRAAEEKNLTVIMQLKEGTDFVMSFSFE